MAVTARKSRNLGIDLMRAMAMFFVICLHILGQGGLIAHAEPDSGKFYFLKFLQILSSFFILPCICHPLKTDANSFFKEMENTIVK